MAYFHNTKIFQNHNRLPWSAQRAASPRRRLIAALGLALAVGGASAIAAESEPPQTAPDSAVELFSSTPKAGLQTMRAGQAIVGREAVQLNRAIADLPLHAKVRFSLPRGVTYELVYDGRQDHPSGNVTWKGYLKDYGDDYRVVITFGDRGVSGRILTPDGEFLVDSDANGEWLIDAEAAGLNPMEMGEDAVIPLPDEIQKRLPKLEKDSFAPVDGQQDSQVLAVAAADPTPTTIDVMILYTPGLANRLGSGLSARLDQLVALSNQTYLDSRIYINLRLVHTEQVNYSDTTTNSAALDALTYGSDPALAGVAGLRDTKGADLVSLIRPFNYSTSGGSCGVAWVGGYNGNLLSAFADYGYSVISDGRDVNGSGYYCQDLTFTHELGHNMGSVHDRANSSFQGAYPYSYGYGVSGTFGTVMSYINPRIGKFSNPAITCAGGIACGVSETASNSANNALSLNSTRTGVASFRPEQSPPSSTSYNLTVASSGSGTVISSPSGIDCGATCSYQFASGTNVALSATPASGYTFAGWSGACTGTGACTVTLTAAKSVTATFTALPKYTLTASKSGSGMVTSAPSGIDCGATCSYQFASGTNVTLSATPASDYTFSGWSGACTGTAACTVTMSTAKSVAATFKAIPKYTLTIYRSGSGTVASSPAGITCGSDCSEPYLNGTPVSLSATPATGYYFSGWSGACTGTGACTVTLTAAKSVTATFKANPVLTVSRSGSGTVVSDVAGITCGSDCSEPYLNGTPVTLSATPATGYYFSGWSGACTGAGACTVTMTAARSVTATFTAIPKYTLTVSRSGSGAVVSDTAGINCGSDCSEPYLSGTVVTLSATPASGYTFGGWTGACTGTGACTVTMTAAKSVTATFTAIPKYTLTVSRSGSGAVVSDMAGITCGSDCSEPYVSGTAVTLTATPASGYTFGGWSGACTGTGVCTMTMTAARSVTAIFTK
jgi:uncharacterized repeat protein (TIGR02543 family)